MATHRTWRFELAGQKHTVEWERTGTERVRVLVDEQPVVDEKPLVPAPRYELTVAGQPALLHIPPDSVSQEYELVLAGQNGGRGAPASAKEIAESERRVNEAGAAEDRLRARLLGLGLVVAGAVMAGLVSYTLEKDGSYRPVGIMAAAAAIPSGLAMMVLGEWEPGAKEGADEDTHSIPWRTKVVMALGTAGAIVGMGMAVGLLW
ncbi:hypothetical protein [Archangium lipolyticum]|uniref:hypothetical protein n=1 Tax=Archangium lipolyticum TaxID=2970465 RepID=UPI00214A6135|nr:hypothetical protein [Archangium lipolyticum]